MTFLLPIEVSELKDQLCSDLAMLGKLYKVKKDEYLQKSVDHGLVDEMLDDGWEEFGAPLKTKTKVRKKKSHDQLFEDQVWCQLYELGYRHLNYDRNFRLPYGKDKGERKQIDIVAADEDSVILIECKSSEKPEKPPSYKTEFEGLPARLGGFKKSLEQLFHRGIRVKYIFATRNLRIEPDSADIARLESTKSFFYNDKTYNYINNLLEKYKGAAHYQFLGMIFRGEPWRRERIELPAIEGYMGKDPNPYYMFSIEPHLLLKMGFILHRTEANESEFPTYQRLLVPSRLKGITSYIEGGGYFPNSVIINFNQKQGKLQFEASSRVEDTRSRSGILKIPSTYAIAYIIDGQHRLYGYANTSRKDTNTIPVVAFVDLEPTQQLKIFMDINENQKAVSASLRLTLEEDLYWNADRLDSRMKALRSSIISGLSGTLNGPLYKKIQIGEDKALLSSKPFGDALIRSGLLPRAKGNSFQDVSTEGALYNVNNHDHIKEMFRARKAIVNFINACYEYVQENFKEIFEREKYLLISNRGTYPFVCLIGELNSFETAKGSISLTTKAEDRLAAIKKYLDAFLIQVRELNPEEEERLLAMRGSEVETKWLRVFQSLVNGKYPEYCPTELIDWKERQDDELQEEGRKLGTEIEKTIKKIVLRKLEQLFGRNWDLEIGDIKRQCESRASEEIQRIYNEGLGRKKIEWTEMFFIMDYKWIIEKHWTKHPDVPIDGFLTFEKEFAIDVGRGFNSKADKLRWMSEFNSYRNLWAHEGSKETRLNKQEVGFLSKLHTALIRD